MESNFEGFGQFNKVHNFLQEATAPPDAWENQLPDEDFVIQKLNIIAEVRQQLDEAVETGMMTRHERDEYEADWLSRYGNL